MPKAARRSIEELADAPWNPREIEEDAIAGLGVSVREYGDLSGIVWNKRSGHLVCGHQRLRALREAGATDFVAATAGWYVEHPETKERFAIRVVDWDEQTELAANVTANNLALHGDFTVDVVAMLEGLEAELPEFESLQLDSLLSDLRLDFPPELKEGETDPDDVPDAPEEPVSKTGDLWLLGEHRLLCGDGLDRETVRRLMEPGRACLIVTDPPYGVAYGSGTADSRLRISGDLSQATIPVGLAVAFEEATDENARVYVFGGSHNWGMYARLFDHHLHREPSPIVWVKDSLVLRRGNYHSRFELVFFGWKGKGGAPEFWYGDRKATDVWEVHRDGDREHPTQKPVEGCSIPIRNSASLGGIVYDPFLGSGTTLIACEQLSRRCFALEIEPRYVDVAVRRWEAFTGKEATLEGDGKTFREISGERAG